MKIIINLIILTTTFFCFNYAAYSHVEESGSFSIGNKPWKMRASIKVQEFQRAFKALSLMDIDISGVDIPNSYIDVLINDDEYRLLEKKKYSLEILSVKGISRLPDAEYQNSEEIENFIKRISDRFPEITHRVSIGKSLEGRDIWALKISDNPKLEELNEPSVLFNSMHHAREVMSPEMGIDIIETLTSQYNSDAKITKWVNNNEIWVIPMFNVDGNNKMWSGDRWWRKNTRGGYGVDLNRNYPTGWDKCNGSSGRRSSQTYRGPKPASEPETQAMMKFIEKVRPVFDISYHSYSELVIYPFGCGDERTQTKEVVEKIGKEIASKLNYKAGTAWELLYNADGGDIDWMYETYQVIPFVIELNSRSEGFHPSYKKWRNKTVERNRAGWQHLLERTDKSGVRGFVSDNGVALSNFTVNVYKVAGSKETLFQNYKGHKTGMFHIVLNPGEYSLVIRNGENKVLKTEEVIITDKLMRLSINI